jgi:tetratricopeptide (TPR) repeat protein
MSLLGGLFKKRSLSEQEAEAEALFAQQRFGDAKLAFDRLEARAEKEDKAAAERARTRAAESCDRIADQRIAEALNLRAGGHLDLAREELRHALETARSPEAQARARAAQKALEQRDAKVQAAAAHVALSDEERLTLISSSWEPLQAEELESYGDALFAALLQLEDGRGKEALGALLPLAERSPEASYLWLEVARAQLVAGELTASEESLRRFIARIGPEEGGTARLLAHRELCKLCHERGDREGAIRELEAAAEALEDDPRPLLDLGNYLRVIERPLEAIEVLELCAASFGDNTVEWPVTMELGLACAEAGEKQRAIKALEQVIELLVTRGHMDLPPAAAVALAKLHEDEGNLARAADLFGALAKGEDVANHALYHREASRLLEALGLSEEARRMRERAEGLAT